MAGWSPRSSRCHWRWRLALPLDWGPLPVCMERFSSDFLPPSSVERQPKPQAQRAP